MPSSSLVRIWRCRPPSILVFSSQPRRRTHLSTLPYILVFYPSRLSLVPPSRCLPPRLHPSPRRHRPTVPRATCQSESSGPRPTTLSNTTIYSAVSVASPRRTARKTPRSPRRTGA
ncbi:hypothetical protein BU23DRAFT_193767 [Bimuria novae-zelandiae CBS 107.79]|uniref:Uncharacterized protein n=1 Tax=Bimuria novae-zelandiae CBS 107.79 TaxID=1447943 RepID=A0A6A5VTM6_9PLEO|nr:hypothetical protein BU23DRAFT_193767 [Bimuria novae-zelandiae CBS 107.79]